MAIYFRVVRSNAVLPADREFLVQVSNTGLAGSWETASRWFQTLSAAEAKAAELLKLATAPAKRSSFTIVSSYSGETA